MSVIYDWKYDWMACIAQTQTHAEFQELAMDMLTMTLQSVQLEERDTNKHNK